MILGSKADAFIRILKDANCLYASPGIELARVIDDIHVLVSEMLRIEVISLRPLSIKLCKDDLTPFAITPEWFLRWAPTVPRSMLNANARLEI